METNRCGLFRQLYKLDGVDFAAVPLKIVTDEREYLRRQRWTPWKWRLPCAPVKNRPAPPAPTSATWRLMKSADGNLYPSPSPAPCRAAAAYAQLAAEEYQAEHPGAQVFVLDSLSAPGPELVLLAEHIRALIEEGKDFDEVCEERCCATHHHTHLLFLAASLANLAEWPGEARCGAVARMLNTSGSSAG